MFGDGSLTADGTGKAKMRSHWSGRLYPLQPVDERGSLDAGWSTGREAGKEGGRDGERGAEKEREEAEVEAEVLFRFQIWTGLGQTPQRNLAVPPWGLCLRPRDLFCVLTESLLLLLGA